MGSTAESRKIVEFSEEDRALLKKLGTDSKYFSLVGPSKYYVPTRIAKYGEEIAKFQVKNDDVWVCTLARSGTTLTQEMVWLICNDMDFKKGLEVDLDKRFLYFEYPLWLPIDTLLERHKDNPEMCEKLRKQCTPPWKQEFDPSVRRLYKTHLPISLLPDDVIPSGSKVIYVARNLGDVLVSSFHQYKSCNFPVPEKFEDFWTLAEKGFIYCFPFFDHVLEAWNLRHKENVLFLFYEDLVKDMEGTIKRVSKFLGKTLNQNQINQLLEHLKFDNFKKNQSVNKGHKEIFDVKEDYHIRKGKVGSSKEEFFTDNLKKKLDKFVEEHLKDTDLKFPAV